MSNVLTSFETFAVSEFFAASILVDDEKLNSCLSEAHELYAGIHQHMRSYALDFGPMSGNSARILSLMTANRQEERLLLTALLHSRNQIDFESTQELQNAIKAIEGLLDRLRSY